MNRTRIVFDKQDPKKHSVRFDTSETNAPISTVYIARTAFPDGKIPKVVVVTLEEGE